MKNAFALALAAAVIPGVASADPQKIAALDGTFEK